MSFAPMSSFVAVAPEFVHQAVEHLENIGCALTTANAAAGSTTRVVAAAGDEVSTAIASLFSSHAQDYQVLAVRAQAFRAEFTNLLNAAADSYISTEIANTSAAAAPVDILESIGNDVLSTVAGASLQEFELPLDALGPVITATAALGQNGTTLVSAIRTGNPATAIAAFRSAASSAQSAFVYGQYTASISIPTSLSGGSSVGLSLPFGGLLAPLEPITATVTTAGYPPSTLAFPEQIGGIISDVQTNGPSVALALLLLPLFLV